MAGENEEWSEERFEAFVRDLASINARPAAGTIKEKRGEGLSDVFNGRILHPSLDNAHGIITFGFRYQTKSLKEKRVFFIETAGQVRIVEDDSFTDFGHEYIYDTKGIHLPLLEERWGVQDAKAFVASYDTSRVSVARSQRSLIERVAALVKKHIGFESDCDAYILAAWTIGTYFHRGFRSYPFLHIKAPKGSGKSQCLTLLEQLAFNASKARPTLAAFGDTVDALRGVPLIDQADSLGQKGTEELLHILADSYKRSGGKRHVMDMEKGRKVLEIETYSPKAFASIKELPEDLRDRCFVLPLIRSGETFLDPDDPSNDWRAWRAEFYKASLTRQRSVDAIYRLCRRKYNENKELVARNLELWLPIETMLMCFGGSGKIEDAKRRFLSQYDFAAYEPSELETEVMRVLLTKTGDSESVEVSPADIASEIDSDFFWNDASNKQRAVAVGRAIGKLNLPSKKRRGASGIRYLIERATIASVHANYFNNELTSPTPPDSDPSVEPKSDVQEISVEDIPF
jgi:hypothetical protein